MKRIIAALVFALSVPSLSLATTPQEQSFTDQYKKAFEAKDEATLKSFLYTKGADPMALEFYTMMITSDMGSKIDTIELRPLTADEAKRAAAEMPSPTGGKSKLPLAATKKLVIKLKTDGANGNSSSSSETFVAEADGKLVIPVPIAVK